EGAGITGTVEAGDIPHGPRRGRQPLDHRRVEAVQVEEDECLLAEFHLIARNDGAADVVEDGLAPVTDLDLRGRLRGADVVDLGGPEAGIKLAAAVALTSKYERLRELAKEVSGAGGIELCHWRGIRRGRGRWLGFRSAGEVQVTEIPLRLAGGAVDARVV